MEKNSTKVVCPVCGTEIAIPNNERPVVGVAIGKDSGLGTVYLPVEKAGNGGCKESQPVAGKSSKAEDRLEALKNAGVDTSNLFAMHGASGDGMIVRMVNGIPSVVPDDDPIFQSIINGGTVPDRRLFRRWVMSQMFHMLTYKGYRGDEGYTAALHNKGYEYQWGMIIEELKVQAKLSKSDMENFRERNRWFNKNVCLALVEDYIKKLRKHIKNLKVKHCKGVPYVTVGGRNIFVDDLPAKLYRPLEQAKHRINLAGCSDTLLGGMLEFNRIRPSLSWDTPQCAAWVDAFKGSGAFYTLKNLILFHGCKIMNTTSNRFFSKQESMDYLSTVSALYKGEGWRLFALMKKTIADNKMNIAAEMKKWRAAKRNK